MGPSHLQQVEKTLHRGQKRHLKGAANQNTRFPIGEKNPADVLAGFFVFFCFTLLLLRMLSIGGHVQIRFLSPYALSTRLTGDQYLSTPMDPGGEAGLFAGVGTVPVAHQIAHRVGGVFQRVVFRIDLAVDDVLRLGPDREHGVAEAVQLVLGFRFRGFDHQGAGHRPGHGRRVEAAESTRRLATSSTAHIALRRPADGCRGMHSCATRPVSEV